VLTRIDLEHFKCFELLKLPVGQLTLLAGTNASGKSSVLQALVLLHQTILDQEWSRRLLLNGTEVSLGTVTDVVDKVTGRRSMGIGLVDDGNSVHWEFEGADRKDMSMAVASVQLDAQLHNDPDTLQFLLPLNATSQIGDLARRLRRLSYLTAERVGPREVYVLEDATSTQVVGARGERAVGWLYCERDSSVLPLLVIDGTPPTRLRQVEARMQEFFPGCSLEVQQIPQANGVTLGLRTSEGTDFHRPIHVGFGLTQVLPIIVAALSCAPDDLLLIENPEVHLHPGGQSVMGTFLAKVAAAGVQVLIETHSDHVLNGVRRAIRMDLLEHDSVQIHFFRDRGLGGEQVLSPTVDSEGNLDVWPDGFFDQFDKDMNYFAGWRD
jgi:predicted ATPase